ncbi:hypothetical protein CB0940_11885 [Cercospora beticola]|uniref:Malate dehydrogenase n=1 Tax=Cercospora beticola TaxID=122368 RepID=A0A2G5IEN1_CERBT|nr:hypothetical protein CB0940_11885 [Cercospora beticola]PIB03122.1 hypothetical protein CB0940_11885 [Cercospora beticola]WPB04245.1 hypothetical protein RHO25_008890 [Cercospora beticola]CAK1356942.1 unnamed protein product [Cercospora beticola]
MTLIRDLVLALATLATSSNALCLPRSEDSKPALPLSKISNTGSTPLPVPSKDPKAIILGLGFQNYTCSSSSSTWVQSTIQAGAIADLYDITSKTTSNTGDRYSKSSLKAFETCLKVTKCTPTTANGFCDRCHTISSAAFASKRVGEHYFDQINGLQMPNFALDTLKCFFSGKKGGGVKAPANAYKGANGLGAVDWLYLVDNNSGRTKGMTSVYRVETAGGVAPSSCSTPGSAMQVPYATEYWFYD